MMNGCECIRRGWGSCVVGATLWELYCKQICVELYEKEILVVESLMKRMKAAIEGMISFIDILF